MKPSSIVITGIWVVSLASSLSQGLELPNSPISQQPMPTETAWVILLFPFIFFLIASFFQRPMTISAPTVQRAVDARFGAGTFNSFMLRLNPIALFAFSAFVLGTTGLVTTYLGTQSVSAYVNSGFFLSGSLGLTCAYLLSIFFPPRLT